MLLPRNGAQREGTWTGPREALLAELGSALFASLPRRDQRGKGLEYVRGLLTADGRKSIRNIAAAVGRPAAEQYLHHFVSDSTWDVAPVRRALANYVRRVVPLRAWVVRPTVIPKAGVHSVGVGRRFRLEQGQSLNAQQAFGVWLASDEVAVPVNWRLYLPRTWLDDERRRRRAAIPDDVRPETFTDCATEVYLGTGARNDFPVRPVVFDGRDVDVVAMVRRLRAARTPFLVRICPGQHLLAADAGLAGHSHEPNPADRIASAVRDRRAFVPAPRPTVAATARVALPHGPQPAGPGDLALLGVGRVDREWPGQLWLTNLVTAKPAALAPLTRLVDVVDRDFTRYSERVGIRDFAGRSFAGWNRHATLASAAHAVAALTDLTGHELRHVS
ncbi:IS701 family transposase [Saccharothrix sp. HUAS TT1]|uniref:IS701 family transposase n=1 Tax=unclassified Saccharothrix TaxID=2593673 RepID=UPI00345C2D48